MNDAIDWQATRVLVNQIESLIRLGFQIALHEPDVIVFRFNGVEERVSSLDELQSFLNRGFTPPSS